MRTQVGIVGAGPAGLFLSLLLQRAGIDCVVLEAKSRDYVESRVRAGVLEQGTVDLMADLGVDARLRRECMIDAALDIRFSGKLIRLDLPGLTGGKLVHIYGQQEVVKDLIAARLASGGALMFEAEVIRLDDLKGERPAIHFTHGGANHTLECDMIAGCDGFHGVCRPAIPADVLTIHDREFPCGWLGVMSESPPLA
jgi:p-hydroxybenzoate 3-monooxygenase